MKPAEKYRAWKAHRPEKPIFRTILFSMMAVLLAEVILLSTGIGLTNVSGRLNQNAKQIVNMQVRNRASYLQDMLIKAQELTDISTTINNLTQQMLQDGTISLDTMDQSSEAADPLMEAAAPYLVSALRARPVTGIFLVINTHDLAEKKVGSPMPSVYLRDLDPDARPSDRKADLMLERSSAAVVKKLGITTDKSWSTALSYRGLTSGGFACTVFQTAWEDDEKLDAADYGRWLTQTYKLTGDERTAIAYSQPLILPDGTVYGVIGVEILTSYLETKMPYQELQDGGQGTYLLVSTTSGLSDPELFLTLMAGDGLDANVIDAGVEKITCRQTDGERWLTLNNETGYAAVQNLDLYSRNAPFSNEKWLLVGTVRSSILFRFAHTVQQVITSAVLLTLLLGAVSSLLVSRGLARPAEQLYCEVLAANGKQTFPKFSHTGIRELDRFAEAITQLNSSLVTNSTKFLRIMDMASVELGGYELRYDTGSVYVTKNFFALLGAPEVDGSSLTVRTFGELLEHIQLVRPCTVNAEGDKVLTVVQGGRTRYIMLRVTTEDRVQVGLAEDVTAATQERLRIERERDYDVLTGLYNRQAFHRVSHELFQNPERLGVAALLMMDLDDLKHINDTYGHDWGDHYIQNTGRCIAEHSPPGTVCARLSGDEFLLLFYGYPGREQLREKLEALTRAMQQAVVVLPSGSDLHISISGGVAWYPEDGRDIETLKKYADFAMYQVKHSTKGQMKDFDIGVYNQEAYIARTRREFHQLISEERMYYYFQPIFSAQTGRVHAYEALMRSDLPTLRSPATIMKLAREQGALYEIERLTFRKALEEFDNLRSKNLVDRQALIFINSIASVSLRREDSEYMDQRWHELRRQMVIEITEEEEMNREALETKRHAPGFSGMFALDDYGSGYSNEGSLLELAPRFIKVDISIIRGIDSDPDKQQILRNVVHYAQPRSMQIIAEGVETAAEMRTVIDLGADLLQGYFLARPAAVPDPIAPEAAEIIRAI